MHVHFVIYLIASMATVVIYNVRYTIYTSSLHHAVADSLRVVTLGPGPSHPRSFLVTTDLCSQFSPL